MHQIKYLKYKTSWKKFSILWFSSSVPICALVSFGPFLFPEWHIFIWDNYLFWRFCRNLGILYLFTIKIAVTLPFPLLCRFWFTARENSESTWAKLWNKARSSWSYPDALQAVRPSSSNLTTMAPQTSPSVMLSSPASIGTHVLWPNACPRRRLSKGPKWSPSLR